MSHVLLNRFVNENVKQMNFDKEKLIELLNGRGHKKILKALEYLISSINMSGINRDLIGQLKIVYKWEVSSEVLFTKVTKRWRFSRRDRLPKAKSVLNID
ncbi:hypothetical protein BpHYR1_048828 [Brachionus plicatilis]|uniref:Uncharacterized protein n=1 Tax=Brachionus plicatilis TaxID=10195 RepID=A0A3M7Q315_BRAPC|nr:hypothetical protein BpHYR1_048828 [Brachionus plicatilis]